MLFNLYLNMSIPVFVFILYSEHCSIYLVVCWLRTLNVGDMLICLSWDHVDPTFYTFFYISFKIFKKLFQTFYTSFQIFYTSSQTFKIFVHHSRQFWIQTQAAIVWFCGIRLIYMTVQESLFSCIDIESLNVSEGLFDCICTQ